MDPISHHCAIKWRTCDTLYPLDVFHSNPCKLLVSQSTWRWYPTDKSERLHGNFKRQWNINVPSDATEQNSRMIYSLAEILKPWKSIMYCRAHNTRKPAEFCCCCWSTKGINCVMHSESLINWWTTFTKFPFKIWVWPYATKMEYYSTNSSGSFIWPDTCCAITVPVFQTYRQLWTFRKLHSVQWMGLFCKYVQWWSTNIYRQ